MYVLGLKGKKYVHVNYNFQIRLHTHARTRVRAYNSAYF